MFEHRIGTYEPSAAFRSQVDTNVVAIKLATLNDGAPIHTGDPLLCAQCRAVFSSVSKISDGGQWKCEFCGHDQPCDLSPQELPTANTVDYIVEAAPEPTRTSNTDQDISAAEIVEEDEVNI